jgi:hypothetical protein
MGRAVAEVGGGSGELANGSGSNITGGNGGQGGSGEGGTFTSKDGTPRVDFIVGGGGGGARRGRSTASNHRRPRSWQHDMTDVITALVMFAIGAALFVWGHGQSLVDKRKGHSDGY